MQSGGEVYSSPDCICQHSHNPKGFSLQQLETSQSEIPTRYTHPYLLVRCTCQHQSCWLTRSHYWLAPSLCIQCWTGDQ